MEFSASSKCQWLWVVVHRMHTLYSFTARLYNPFNAKRAYANLFNLLFIVKQPFSVEKHMHSVFYYSCCIIFFCSHHHPQSAIAFISARAYYVQSTLLNALFLLLLLLCGTHISICLCTRILSVNGKTQFDLLCQWHLSERRELHIGKRCK